MNLGIPYLVKVDLIGETFLELAILVHLLMLNIDRSNSPISHARQHSENARIIPDIQRNKMFQKNQYNNSNDSSHENKSFYDIVKDSPLIQEKDINMNNSSESQKEFLKALREQ